MSRYTMKHGQKALDDMRTIMKYTHSLRPIVRWWDEEAEEYHTIYIGYGDEAHAITEFMRLENQDLMPVLFLYDENREYEIVILGELEDWQ